MPTNPPAVAKVLDDVKVTQADRKEVAALHLLLANDFAAGETLAGACDERPLVQAFARHRIASTIPDAAALDAAEARGRAAERADVVGWLRAKTDTDFSGPDARTLLLWFAYAIEAGEHLAKEAWS